jgi:hypothetical protein
MLNAPATGQAGGSMAGGDLTATIFADRPRRYTVVFRRQLTAWEDSVFRGSKEWGEPIGKGIEDEREALDLAVGAATQHSCHACGIACVYLETGEDDSVELLYRVYQDGHVERCDPLAATTAAVEIGRMIRTLLLDQRIPPRAATPAEIVSCYRDIAGRYPHDRHVAQLGDIQTASREIWGSLNRTIRGLPG